MVVKKKKKKCLMHVDPELGSFPLVTGHLQIHLYDNFFFSKLYLLDSIFTSYIFGLRGCMILMKEYVSLTYFDGNASIKTRACLHGHTLGILRVCLP